MEREELAGWLRLTLTPGIGNTTARRLLAAFGLPAALFGQSAAALRPFLSDGQIQALHAEAPELEAQLAATWQWLHGEDGHGRRRVVTWGDSSYPAPLLNIEDPPPMLYMMGMSPEHWPAAIAVVGSRNPTPQGLANARRFARSFAQSGFSVVSGLALGVDGAAHQGALEGAAAGDLATVAVVGTGLDQVYPRQHLELALRIAQDGLLVSEYPIGTPPLAPNFPKRNRLIAALSQGTVVVEAALQSGSLITARQAAEQGKDVFAIPGSIHSPQSRGCHALLKQGAKLVETAQDVLEELRMPGVVPPTGTLAPTAANPDAAGDAPEDALLPALGFDPVSLDALVARTGISPAWLQGRLLELELEGKVARLPGGLFQRVGAA
jgi:DNA processing protein